MTNDDLQKLKTAILAETDAEFV
ncbi:MAG: hypothetical protein QG616_1695, partial [Pseudomonadota bacterium]|nr:hypothetical protein [Pseudomonadota bacterium]